MLARSGPHDEISSPVMVVAQTRCRNIAKSQELAKEKLKVTASSAFINLRIETWR
jgi:hypothetical protein